MFTGTNGDAAVTDRTGGARTWDLTVGAGVVDGVLVLAASGRLGSGASGTLIEAVVAGLRGGHRRILCDLGGVDYASSAGLLALDAIAGRVAVDSGAFVLCNLTEPVRLVLDLSGLLPQLTILPSREAGLAHFATGAGLQSSSVPRES